MVVLRRYCTVGRFVGGVWLMMDYVEKNLHRLATMPFFYTHVPIPLWLITVRPRTVTVPNIPNDSTAK